MVRTNEFEEKSKCCRAVFATHHLVAECSKCGAPFIPESPDQKKVSTGYLAEVGPFHCLRCHKDFPMTSGDYRRHHSQSCKDELKDCGRLEGKECTARGGSGGVQEVSKPQIRYYESLDQCTCALRCGTDCADMDCTCKKHSKSIPEWEKDFVELGADLEHDRWARWQNHFFCKCNILRNDGKYVDLCLDVPTYERWLRQIDTPYSKLSESEKESDRKETRNYLPLIKLLLENARVEERSALDAMIEVAYRKGVAVGEMQERERIAEYVERLKNGWIQCTSACENRTYCDQANHFIETIWDPTFEDLLTFLQSK